MKRETLTRFNQVAEQYNASIAVDHKTRHLVLLVVPSSGQSFSFPVPSKIDRGEDRTLHNTLAGFKRELRKRERYVSKAKRIK
jgi:hypothetical protein